MFLDPHLFVCDASSFFFAAQLPRRGSCIRASGPSKARVTSDQPKGRIPFTSPGGATASEAKRRRPVNVYVYTTYYSVYLTKSWGATTKMFDSRVFFLVFFYI